MGFLHNNMTMAEQITQATTVKAHEPGFLAKPLTLRPDATIADFEAEQVPLLPGQALLGPALA